MRFFSILVLLSALISAFGGVASAKARFKVVTTFTIIADMASNVAGEHAEVVSITKPGVEIHNYSATPQDILKAQNADLVLWNGLDLELWFQRFFKNLRNVPEAVVSEGVVAIPIGQGVYQGRPNPHAWMSPVDALLYVDNIANAMATHDPSNASAYRKNAAEYKQKIQAQVEFFRAAFLALPTERRWLVTSEGAFSYLTRDFGLEEVFLWPINADQQGTPRQVLGVIETVRANNISVVFSESTISPDFAIQIARETDARYGGVLYVDSLSTKDGPVPTYLDLISVTTKTILRGLQE